MTALQKPNGRGIRALVVGDVLRRLVGRALLRPLCHTSNVPPSPVWAKHASWH